MARYVTSKEIEYHCAPYGYIATIPKRTRVKPATNLPETDGPQFWVDPWPGMTRVAEDWGRSYGFLVGENEIAETCPGCMACLSAFQRRIRGGGAIWDYNLCKGTGLVKQTD